ncbi:MAG: 1-acyl-sn-glycerol-3-phosphate acyltransferase [Muribaculaceae bacterium]|nr:1-acyl-sn-glycerol-3-phosphate acyltransferase [Muribaculaceae bacterium]
MAETKGKAKREAETESGTLKILQLDIRQILKSRIPKKKRRWIPSFLISMVERLIRQRELNEILRATLPSEGSEFSHRVLDYLDISIDVEGLDNLKEGERYMFASNHPLGGLDGMALIKVLGEKYGDDNIRFLVNDLLMNVEPLKKIFLPVNKFGSQGREYAQIINEKMESSCQIFQFPAGLCSRLQDNGIVEDMEWQKSFVTKALETDRAIVPVYFEGNNSKKFYRMARLRKRLGIGFNLEQVLLPSELCKARGSRFRIVFGHPIPAETLRSSGQSPKALAAKIRSASYSLSS